MDACRAIHETASKLVPSALHFPLTRFLPSRQLSVVTPWIILRNTTKLWEIWNTFGLIFHLSVVLLNFGQWLASCQTLSLIWVSTTRKCLGSRVIQSIVNRFPISYASDASFQYFFHLLLIRSKQGGMRDTFEVWLNKVARLVRALSRLLQNFTNSESQKLPFCFH